MRQRSRGSSLGWIKVGLLGLVFVFVIWTAGLFTFASNIPTEVVEPDLKTDAIVVLTGGSGRLRTGLDLLMTEHAAQLFVSGVYRGVDVDQLLKVQKQRPEDVENRISLGDAINTRENAFETAEWMRANNLSSLRLVTAAYHMPRSLLEFGNVLADVKIAPHPVFPDHVKQSKWWAFPGTFALTVTEYNKFLLAWTRQLLARGLSMLGIKQELF